MTSGDTERAEYRGEALAVRGMIGGVLMGLANLVPGISGGTMLLAVGVYPHFIDGVAEVSTLRFRARSLLMLACIIGGALVAILGLAGVMGDLVVHHRWIMYSLFIGLTLGGVPILWPMLRPADSRVVVFTIAAVAVMAAMALLAPGGTAAAGDGRPYAMYFLAGLAGASAMVLPGISGGYLLLVLGQYVAILGAVAALKNGLRGGAWDEVTEALHVIVPVGVGVVVGVVGVSNLVKLLLARFERATLSVLLGLLLGAVLGLWPFQTGAAPEVGATFRGDTVALADGVLVMARSGRPIEPADYDTVLFAPSALQIAGALALIAAGFAASVGIAHLGGRSQNGGETLRSADSRASAGAGAEPP